MVIRFSHETLNNNLFGLFYTDKLQYNCKLVCSLCTRTQGRSQRGARRDPAPPDKVLAPPGWPGAVYRKFPK